MEKTLPTSEPLSSEELAFQLPPVLDACCGARRFWCNQPDPYVSALAEAGIRAERDRRIIERHVRWRETALSFLHQVIDGRGTEDEWPALAEFIERSESRIEASTAEKANEPSGEQ